MIKRNEARLNVLLTAALEDLAVVEQYGKLLDIALERTDPEETALLVDCFRACLLGKFGDAVINVRLAQKELKNLLTETE